MCPFLVAGALLVDLKIIEESVHQINWLSTKYGGEVQVGGWWRPKSCKPRFKVRMWKFRDLSNSSGRQIVPSKTHTP